MIRNIVFILLFAVLIFGTYQSSYPSQTPKDLMYQGFWLENALNHLNKISDKPHPTGSQSNVANRRYLSEQLSQLGGQVTLQKTQAYNAKIRKAAPVNNIIALFPGKNSADKERKKLMLLSHYDSAKVYSKGAADAGSGVAVILESMRHFLKNNPERENDIIVMFSDGEELGLLGAHAFAQQHHLIDSIGLILNFEARGSSGPAIMWPESASGTTALINAYDEADVEFPVTSSLIYEVYKMLPNDTDLTVFKEEKGINGLNFAFIDNHFNYHTINDDVRHLSYNSLMHQGLQLSALLPVVANTNLSETYSNNDNVYFTLPVLGLVNWPAAMGWGLIILAWFMLFLVVILGKKSGLLIGSEIKTASTSWLLSCLLSAGLSYGMIYILYQWLNPEHSDILQGYPYLGYGYVLAILLAALVAPFIIYGNRHKVLKSESGLPAAVVWLIAFSLLSLKLPGASYLLLPVICSFTMMLVIQVNEKTGVSFAVLFATVGLLILALLLTLLPVALGLKSTWIAALLLTSCLSMFAPIFANHNKKYSWFLLFLPITLFLWINSNDSISEDKPLPTSLSYLYDVDEEQGWFYSFDRNDNAWNQDHFTQTSDKETTDWFIDTHKQAARKLQAANDPVSLKHAKISVINDKLNNNPSKQNIIYQGHEHSSLVQIYSNTDITIKQMSINGRYTINGTPVKIRQGSRLIEYHMDGQKELNMHVTLADGDVFDWQVISHQFDLLSNPQFDIPERPTTQIPKPFILTDNTVVSQRFQIKATAPLDADIDIEVN
ncbi:M28 family peptidase [Marinicella rhabdoformis]|uniref:M28 family peptidase n=1 Tax=Marinicella rhabdoformis TaxID=2580566 RepID=UPI0012AED100|nr:M28 family peptidase [Marinicella rhabdoformis]